MFKSLINRTKTAYLAKNTPNKIKKQINNLIRYRHKFMIAVEIIKKNDSIKNYFHCISCFGNNLVLKF